MNTIDIKNFTEIGKVRKAHGVNGALNIDLTVEGDSVSIDMEFLFLMIDGALVPFSLEEIEIKPNQIIAEFEEIGSKTDAEKYTYCKVFIENEFLFDEEAQVSSSLKALIDYQLIDKQNGISAQILDLIEYPNNPVFEIELNNNPIMLPAQEELIEAIDDTKKEITYNIPDGLIDVYLEE